ncbi:hypothetical protein ANN_19988 [Periplaneta americana]|uniref:HAT C-terminal dimerisation domain-containing protein n=1 Tax=Periplaneta americana TaxID=6978 RepID=A0ABQ8SCH2_PERAM|nr:hypothetical protein ANN_19988 [Periplaneta americana]
MAGLCEDGNEPPGSIKATAVERSFSAYKFILSDIRRSFSFETLKIKVVLLFIAAGTEIGEQHARKGAAADHRCTRETAVERDAKLARHADE